MPTRLSLRRCAVAKKDRDAVNESFDAIFGGTDSDILGNVIQSDRRRAGRELMPTPTEEPKGEPTASPPVDYDNKTSPTDINQYNNKTIGHYDNNTIGQQDSKTVGHSDNKTEEMLPKPTGPRKRPQKGETSKDQEGNALLERVKEAKRMAQSPTMTVTLRIPRGMNDWLDEYVHRAWPERIKKQELVIEALQMLIARRGRAGEAVFPTELLPEKEP